MVILKTRFALLAALYTLVPTESLFAHGAVIQSRYSKSVALDENYTHRSQRFFSHPQGAPDDDSPPTLGDYSPTNPLHQLVNIVLTQWKSSYGDVSHQQRRSIAIPNNRGGKYLVSHRAREPRHARNNKREGSSQDQMGVPGNVAIMVRDDEGHLDRAAWLFLHSSDNKTYDFVASDVNKTQMYLIDAPQGTYDAGDQAGTEKKRLQIPMSDKFNYCATYLLDYEAEQNVTLDRCMDSSDGHRSQTFAYNPSSQILQPFNRNDSTSSSTPQNSTVQTAVISRADGSSSSNSTRYVMFMFVPLSSNSSAVAASIGDRNSTSTYPASATSTSMMAMDTGVSSTVVTSSVSATGTTSGMSVVPSQTGGLEVELVGDSTSSTTSSPSATSSTGMAAASMPAPPSPPVQPPSPPTNSTAGAPISTRVTIVKQRRLV